MKTNWNLDKFSDHLFWDVNKVLLTSDDEKFVLKRVLEYGQLSDWKHLLSYLTISEISDICADFKDLDNKALSFISTLSKKPRDKFLCYNSKQSTNPHWIF